MNCLIDLEAMCYVSLSTRTIIGPSIYLQPARLPLYSVFSAPSATLLCPLCFPNCPVPSPRGLLLLHFCLALVIALNPWCPFLTYFVHGMWMLLVNFLFCLPFLLLFNRMHGSVSVFVSYVLIFIHPSHCTSSLEWSSTTESVRPATFSPVFYLFALGEPNTLENRHCWQFWFDFTFILILWQSFKLQNPNLSWNAFKNLLVHEII